jgi:uracil-DNA glycosylase
MTEAANLLMRLLRQRSALGESELILEATTIEALREFVRRPEEATGAIAVAADQSAKAATGSRGPGTPVSDEPRSVERSLERWTLPPPRDLERLRTGDGPAPAPVRPRSRETGPLAALRESALACTACDRAGTRASVVFGEGPATARLVIVGDAPSAEDDRSARPFDGRPGRLLDLMLASAGLDREQVYLSHALKCHAASRKPHPAEIEACSPFLRRQLEVIRPGVVLALGVDAAQLLLESTEPLGRLRGGDHSYLGIPLIPTYSPSAAVLDSAWLRPMWEDFQRMRRILENA